MLLINNQALMCLVGAFGGICCLVVLTGVEVVRIVRISAADADKNEAKRMSLAEWV